MECYLHPTAGMNKDLAVASCNERIKFADGKSYPCLFDITAIKKVTREARVYLANEGDELVSASAILVNSAITKMIGNFFIDVDKPRSPTRLFTDKQEALKWLEQFQDRDNSRKAVPLKPAGVEPSNKKRFDFKYFHLIISDGIMECYLKPTAEMDLETARTCSDQRIEVSGRRSYPCIFDITAVKKITKEARVYLANEGNELVSASAILVSSAITKMIANFFIDVDKPKNPTRLFTDKEEALKWLEQFKSSPRSEQLKL